MTEETTTNNTNKPRPRFGIIQSRGLGDLIIALPIARYYEQQGYSVVWPICEEFFPSMVSVAPWVNWVPMTTDPEGRFFYDKPFEIFQIHDCESFVCLYQSLTGHPELSGRNYFQVQKFDEHKYTAATVPFWRKWTLNECITRDLEREAELKKRIGLKADEAYYVTHLKGSSYSCLPDLSSIPPEWRRVDVDDYLTESVFDWLGVIEGAEALVCLDSVVANMVDMMDLQVDKYWIPRSHIHLTPVLGSSWTILTAPPDSIAAKPIFRSN